MTISPRENFLKTLRREGFESVPFDIELCPSQMKTFHGRTSTESVEEYFNFQHRMKWMQMEMISTDWQRYYPEELMAENPVIDEWGKAHSKGSDAAFHMTRLHSPLKGDYSLADIEEYPYPRIKESEPRDLQEYTQKVHEAGFAVMGGMAQTIWETAWGIRGMEELMMDMICDEDKAACILDKVTEIAIQRAKVFAAADVDVLQLGDDIGMQKTPMMSVELWRKWLKPRLAKVISEARSVKPDLLIFYHSCGFVEPFIPELVEIGVEILNPLQPESMDIDTLIPRWKNKLSFWGTIGTQQLMPFGTPEECSAAVHHSIALCGEQGGIVISPTHLVEPEVPWENIMAVYKATTETI